MTVLRHLLLVFLLLVPLPSQAQPLAVHLERAAYANESAIAGHSVMALLRHEGGVLWMGTQQALTRYDGLRALTATPLPGDAAGDARSLYVTALAPDADAPGGVWAGTEAGRVLRYDPGADGFASLRPEGLPADAVTALHASGAGRVWIGLRRRGLYRADAPYVAATHVLLPSDSVYAVRPSAARPGHLWVGTGAGLAEVDGAGVLAAFHLRGVAVTALAEADGALWCGTATGVLYRLDLRAESVTAHSLGLPASTIVSSLEASRARPGLLWIGTRGVGVMAFDAAARQVRPLAPRPSSAAVGQLDVMTLHEDPQGLLWIGTLRNGLFRASTAAPRFVPSRLDAQGSEPDVDALLASRAEPGIVWLGMIQQGVARYDERAGRVTRLFDTPDHRLRVPFALHEEAGGALWVAAEYAALYRIDPLRGTVEAFPLGDDPAQRLILKALYTPPSRPGVLYAGTRNAGLFEFDVQRQTVTRHFADATLAGAQHVWSLTEPPDEPGVLYLATNDAGLVRLDLATGHAARVRPTDDAPCPIEASTLALAADDRGTLWIGTHGQGFARLNRHTGECMAYDARTGFDVPDPGALALDARGRLWMSSNTAGLALFDADREAFTRFTEHDGLQGTHFYFNALHRQPGRLLFGGRYGFNAFDPETIVLDTTSFATLLVGLRADGTPRPLQHERGAYKTQPFTHEERDVEFLFAGMDLRAPRLNRYRVRLDEGDAEGSWRYVSAEQASERYPRLAPGRYTLRVESTNRDGVWSRHAAVLPFRILPPFYATWWFRGLLVLAAAAIGLTLHRMRVRQLLRLERLRSRIAGDLHDEIGADVSALALRAEAASVRAPFDADARQAFEQIGGAARETAQRVREVVWVLNARYDTLGKLVSKLEDTAAALLAGCLPYSFHRPGDVPDVPIGMEARQHVYFLFKEALRNAAEHARATRLDIAVGFERGCFTFAITDDGTGFDPGAGRQGNGLTLMRERAEKSGGTLDIDSAPGKGTTVRFALRLKG